MTIDLLQTGAAWLADQLASYAAQTVIYRRGSAACQLDATPGMSEAETLAGDAAIATRVRDWIIAVDRLTLNGQRVEPAAGDLIDWQHNNTLYRFQVMPIGGDAWEWFGQHMTAYRVHVRLTKATP